MQGYWQFWLFPTYINVGKVIFFPKNYFDIILVSETVSPSCYFSLIKFQDENCDFRLFPSIWDLKIIILGYCDINTSRKHRNYRCELFFLVTTLPVSEPCTRSQSLIHGRKLCISFQSFSRTSMLISMRNFKNMNIVKMTSPTIDIFEVY